MGTHREKAMWEHRKQVSSASQVEKPQEKPNLLTP